MPPLAKNDVWDDEEYEEEDLTDYNKSTKDAILICLDASMTMQKAHKGEGDGDESEDDDEDGGPSYFQGALKAIFELQKRKALKNPSDQVGILIYNTAKLPENELEESTGMYTLAKLATVDIEQVKDLKYLVDEADRDPSSLTAQIPPLEKAVSTTALIDRVITEFKEAGIKDGGRRIFLITDDDNPVGRMKDATKTAKQVTSSTKVKMKDLSELGASVVPFFLPPSDKEFDPTKFWGDILSDPAVGSGTEGDDPTEQERLTAEDGLVAFESLLSEMQVKQSAKRALWTVPLMLTDDLVIGVKGYGLLTEAKKATPKYYLTDAPQAEMAESSTKYFDARDDGAFPTGFDPDQLRQAFDFSGKGTAEPPAPRYGNAIDDTGGEASAPASIATMDVDPDETQQDEIIVMNDDTEDEDVKPGLTPFKTEGKRIEAEGDKKPKITFSRAELAKLKNLGIQPSIKILGYQDADTLKFSHNIKHSYFIYPDETIYTGSTRTFTAVLRTLLDKEKIGIARCVYRKGSTPLICALVPQEETFTDKSAQDKPPGFHLIPFPFMDDMRDPPNRIKGEPIAVLEADEEHAKLMCRVISKLKGGPYQPENFPNPTLARHYAHLESLVFDEPWNQAEAEKVPDQTAPLWEMMHERAGSRMAKWNQSIKDDPMAHTIVVKSSKATTTSDPSTKRKAQVDLDIDLEVVRDKYKDGTLAKSTVPVLKSFLRSVSRLPPGAPKKADLLAATETYLSEEAAQ